MYQASAARDRNAGHPRMIPKSNHEDIQEHKGSKTKKLSDNFMSFVKKSDWSNFFGTDSAVRFLPTRSSR